MEAMNYLPYMTTLITDIHAAVTRLALGIFSVKEGVGLFYEYMQFLAKYGVNPLIVPPSKIWCILLDIKQDICLHPSWPCQWIQMIIFEPIIP